MTLLSRLDQALGPGPMEKPIFTISDTPSTPLPNSEILNELSAGLLDSLFPQTTPGVSDLYRQALHPLPSPGLSWFQAIRPHQPRMTCPKYPPLARVAHITGRVQFTAQIDPGGHLSDLKIISGDPAAN